MISVYCRKAGIRVSRIDKLRTVHATMPIKNA
jgi:hypothetical protein